MVGQFETLFAEVPTPFKFRLNKKFASIKWNPIFSKFLHLQYVIGFPINKEEKYVVRLRVC